MRLLIGHRRCRCCPQLILVSYHAVIVQTRIKKVRVSDAIKHSISLP